MATVRTPTLTIPETLHVDHAALLREHHFETAGALGDVIRNDEYDGVRIIYIITNPEQTEIVYVGDTEEGRNVRGRLKDHLGTRSKAGKVEKTSLVFVHVMVTEYMVLDRFEEVFGRLPVLNKRKVPKHRTRNFQVNGREAMEAERAAKPEGSRAVTLLNPSTLAAKTGGNKAEAELKKKPKKSRVRKVTLFG